MTYERLVLWSLLGVVAAGSIGYMLAEQKTAAAPAAEPAPDPSSTGIVDPVTSADVHDPPIASVPTPQRLPSPLAAACCQPLTCILDEKKEQDLEAWFGLNPDRTCRRCESGRTSIPVCCERTLPKQDWSIRAARVTTRDSLGQEVQVEKAYPSAVLCMRGTVPQEPTLSVDMHCVRLGDIPNSRSASSKSLLVVSTDDLTKLGVDILVHDGLGTWLAWTKDRARHDGIGVGALCAGLRYRSPHLESNVLRDPKVLVFLDDPPGP